MPFSIKSRPGDPFYFVSFRSPVGDRLERSTKETSLKRAEEAAVPIIKEEYEPKTVSVFVNWDETVEQLKTALAQNNNKPKTVKDYLSSIKVLRDVSEPLGRRAASQAGDTDAEASRTGRDRNFFHLA